ncbi:MAG: hypothetical protein LBH00_12005, partial [Planctomycetaceae bacterium]|nr:hypothetical protein [Planctomycetaceae bacterium]
PKNADGLKQWFNGALQQYGIPQQSAAQAREWSTLGHTFYYGQSGTDALAAWNSLANMYRSFRQGEGVGRNQGQQHNRPGRSRWAEAETIRNITNQSAAQHCQQYVQPRQNAFPRAEFGLPIITHFKDTGEPADTEINHPQGDRMGSPLILRPLKIQDGKIVPVVLRLQTEVLQSVKLKEVKNGRQLADNVPVRIQELANWKDSPMYKRTQTGSALEAFLTYCKEQHYTEVK